MQSNYTLKLNQHFSTLTLKMPWLLSWLLCVIISFNKHDNFNFVDKFTIDISFISNKGKATKYIINSFDDWNKNDSFDIWNSCSCSFSF